MSKYIRLDDDKRTRVKIGGLKWFWYRIVKSTPVYFPWCLDCHKFYDTFNGNDIDLCTCAFELDMKGMS